MNKTTSGIALTGFAAVFTLLALTPASASFMPTSEANNPTVYGMAELVHKNVDGDVLASQTVHNRLLNTGEATLIQGAFGTHAANEAPRLICLTDNAVTPITANANVPAEESLDASNFDPSANFAGSAGSCIEADIDTTAATSMAVMTATFYGMDNTTTQHIGEAGATVTHLVICNQVDSTTDFTDCDAAGEAFSAVLVSQTVGAADSVEVTYRFDLTSPSD